jgi:hypothetical protein
LFQDGISHKTSLSLLNRMRRVNLVKKFPLSFGRYHEFVDFKCFAESKFAKGRGRGVRYQ